MGCCCRVELSAQIFFWTIIEKACLLLLLHMLLCSKPNMVSQSYRCFLPNFPPAMPATWTHVAVNETYRLLQLPCCQDIWGIYLSSQHYLLKVFWGALVVVNFSSLWVSSLISVVVVVLFCFPWSRPVHSFWHTQVYALGSSYRFLFGYGEMRNHRCPGSKWVP